MSQKELTVSQKFPKSNNGVQISTKKLSEEYDPKMSWVWDDEENNFGPIFVNVLIGLIPGVYILLVALFGRIAWKGRWNDPIEALEEVYGDMGPVRRIHITSWITWQEVVTVVFALTSILFFLFSMLLLQVEGRKAPTADRWQSLGALLLCVDALLLIAFHRSSVSPAQLSNILGGGGVV